MKNFDLEKRKLGIRCVQETGMRQELYALIEKMTILL